MKRFHYNRIIFICIAFFIVINLLSKSLITSLVSASYQFLQSGDMEEFPVEIDNSLKEMRYQNLMVDLQSWKYRLLGVRKIEKEDSTVIRMPNDYLFYRKEDISNELVEMAANACIDIKEATENLQIPFLYVYAPSKQYYDTEDPEHRKHCDEFLQLLEKGNVDVLNIAEKMEEQAITMEDAYFVTDHHWNIETAFWATTELCKELNRRYGFQYDEKTTSLSNYKIQVYEDWFLGSEGKKAGRFFTPLGVDDISLITPNFETNLSVTAHSSTKRGSFSETLLRMRHIAEKDYYNKSSYHVYTGGDYPIQIIENHLSDNDQKILIIRDSFACAVTPFLSLNAKSMHCLDIRRKENKSRGVEDVFQYIQEYNPDYVIILYSELEITEDNCSKYEFK